MAMIVTFSLSIMADNPIHQDSLCSLFHIARSKDKNEIHYLLNLRNQQIPDVTNPIKAVWIMNAENQQEKPLTYIQQKFAYGIVYDVKTNDYFKFHFAGYSKRVFELKRNALNQFRVFTLSNNREIEVTQIFIHITGGSFWFPEIPVIELHGYNPKTNNMVTEYIKP